MGGILVPRAMTRQPQQAVALNRAALPGLRMAYTPGLAPGATIGSGAAINIGRAGRQWYASAGGNTESSYIPFAPVTSSEWTFFVLGSTSARAGFEVFADFNDGAPAATNRISISRSAYGSANVGSDARPYAPDYNSNTYLAENAPPTLIVLTISAKANQLCMYVDGQVAGTSTLSSTSAVTLSMLQLFSKGGYNNGGDWLNAGSAVILAGLCDRAITPNEVAKLRANPWMVYASTPLLDGPVMAALMAPPSSGTAAQLTGSAVTSATGSGSLNTSIKLTGASATVTAASGALTTSIKLAGSSNCATGATGGLSTSIQLAGTSNVAAYGSGALATSIKLAGAATTATLATGSFAGSAAALTGAGVTVVSASGALTTSIALAGAATSLTVAAGALASAITFAGATAVQAAGAGALATGIRLGGASMAATVGQGSLVTGSQGHPDGGVVLNVASISVAHIVPFEGSGSRLVVFDSSGNRMRFDAMSAKVPTKVGSKWTVDRDPDEISYYAADVTDELADRNTSLASGNTPVELILQGVELLEGPSVQTASVGSVLRTYIVVKLGGVAGELPTDWLWTARVSCANGERFDKTTWFNKVDT